MSSQTISARRGDALDALQQALVVPSWREFRSEQIERSIDRDSELLAEAHPYCAADPAKQHCFPQNFGPGRRDPIDFAS